MILFSIIFASILAFSSAERRYDDWTLYKVHAETEVQVDVLNQFRDESADNIQVWFQGNLQKPYDIVVAPLVKYEFLTIVGAAGINFEVVNENVQNLIDEEKIPAPPARTRGFGSSSSFKNSQWFSSFLTLDQINSALKNLSAEYPSLVQLESIGKSYEGRDIMVAKVGGNTGSKNKPGIWIDGGIHAREWASPATVLFILNKLVTNYESSSVYKNYIDGATWYILPVLNPDGYAYTHTRDRMWRKNRRPISSKCTGVDLNRNYAFGFGGKGTSAYPCDDTYRGPSAFSEPESQAQRNYVTSHKDIRAFLTIHAYSQMWFYPFGHELNSYPSDRAELESLANKGAAALAKLYGTHYDVGTAADLLYEAAGGSDDWAKGTAGIKYVYCLELRPGGDAPGNGFLLPPREIIPTAEETWAGLSVVADAVVGRSQG